MEVTIKKKASIIAILVTKPDSSPKPTGFSVTIYLTDIAKHTLRRGFIDIDEFITYAIKFLPEESTYLNLIYQLLSLIPTRANSNHVYRGNSSDSQNYLNTLNTEACIFKSKPFCLAH